MTTAWLLCHGSIVRCHDGVTIQTRPLFPLYNEEYIDARERGGEALMPRFAVSKAAAERLPLTHVPPRIRKMAMSVQRSNVLGISPVLVVYPLMRAVDFYWKRLGFDHPQLYGDPATMAVLERDGFRLCLQECDFDMTISPGGDCCDVQILVGDLDAEVQALRSFGVAIDFGPAEVIDGIRKRQIIEIVDPDNYRICIEQHTWLRAGAGHA